MNKIALNIGIGYYNSSSIPKLDGTVNDSLDVSNFMSQVYGYNVINMNDLMNNSSSPYYPSKSNIIKQITNILKNANNGDMIVISYAGHGTQIRSNTSEEADGLDEVLVPADYNLNTGNNAIVDDQIHSILKTYLANKPNTRVFLLFDCCHYGTGADLKFTYNYDGKTFSKADEGVPNDIDAKVIMISGCADNQVSWSDLVNLDGGSTKTMQGIMTSAFIHSLRVNPKSISNVFEVLKTMYPYTSQYKQNPQISSNFDIAASSISSDRTILDPFAIKQMVNNSTSNTMNNVVVTANTNIKPNKVNKTHKTNKSHKVNKINKGQQANAPKLLPVRNAVTPVGKYNKSQVNITPCNVANNSNRTNSLSQFNLVKFIV